MPVHIPLSVLAAKLGTMPASMLPPGSHATARRAGSAAPLPLRRVSFQLLSFACHLFRIYKERPLAPSPSNLATAKLNAVPVVGTWSACARTGRESLSCARRVPHARRARRGQRPPTHEKRSCWGGGSSLSFLGGGPSAPPPKSVPSNRCSCSLHSSCSGAGTRLARQSGSRAWACARVQA